MTVIILYYLIDYYHIVNCHVITMHSLHTRCMFGIICSLHGSVRFSYVPYVVHGTHPSQHVAVLAPHPFLTRSYRLYVCFIRYLPVYHPLDFVKFCQIWHRIRTSKNVWSYFLLVSRPLVLTRWCVTGVWHTKPYIVNIILCILFILVK